MKKFALFGLCLLSIGLKAQVFDITTFGAVGNGATVNTTAIQAAIDSCNKAGGGTVEVPTGNFVTGTLFLKSNVTIHISKDGIITGSTTIADYPDVNPLLRTITDGYPQKSVFYAEGQHNIAVTGEGTFNGNGNSLLFYLSAGSSNRPYGFRFISCTNVRYEGLKLRHSAFWMMHNCNIDTLVIKNLDIINQAFGNNDGVNIDGCRNVLVDSVFADCNDDPMVIKSTALIACENIEIKNCTVATYSRGIKIGTETFDNIKNVHVHDCKVQFSTAGPFGSNSPAKSGINIASVNGSNMQNVLFENITMTGINTPIVIRLGNQPKKYTNTAPLSGMGSMRNIELRNITATASSDTTSSITGIPGHDIRNVKLKNIDITYPGGWPALPAYYTVPENEAERPEANIFGDTLPASGLYIRHIDSLQMENVCFHAVAPDGRPDIFSDDVKHLDTLLLCGDFVIGVDAIENSQTFSAYPNPVTGKLNLTGNKLAGGKLSIFDLNGREVKTVYLSSNKPSIDVRELGNGFYFLSVVQGSEKFTAKVVKQ